MRIFSVILALSVLSCTAQRPQEPGPPHSPPTAIECMNTCDAQRELCIQVSTRISHNKSIEECMSDWTQCVNMCMSLIRD
jgi:hypothetical protein